MQSTRDSRQPYRLSNLDLVTESLTLMAGTASSPFCDIWYRRCTPVVVSSVTPRIWDRRLEYHLASTARRSRIAANNTRSRSEEHTSELQSLMRISYAVFCLKKKKSKIATKR